MGPSTLKSNPATRKHLPNSEYHGPTWQQACCACESQERIPGHSWHMSVTTGESTGTEEMGLF